MNLYFFFSLSFLLCMLGWDYAYFIVVKKMREGPSPQGVWGDITIRRCAYL